MLTQLSEKEYIKPITSQVNDDKLQINGNYNNHKQSKPDLCNYDLDLNEINNDSSGYKIVFLDDNLILELSKHADVDIVDADSIIELINKKKFDTEAENDSIRSIKYSNTEDAACKLQENADNVDTSLNNSCLERINSELINHQVHQNVNCNLQEKGKQKRNSSKILDILGSLSETLGIQETDFEASQKISADQIMVNKGTLKQFVDLLMSSTSVQALVKKEQLRCGYCSLEFDSHSKLVEHLSNFHLEDNQKEKECGFCSKVLPNKVALKNHIINIHKVNSQPLICRFCKIQFKSKSFLQRHENGHHDLKNYICKVCGLHIVGAQRLLKHTKSHFNKDEIKYLTCLKCNVAFKTESMFESHLKDKHNWKNNVEPSKQLQIHEITSSQDEKVVANWKNNQGSDELYIFRCNKCCICFKNNESVMSHMNSVHKNILCKKCGIYFSYMTDYELHMAEHLNGAAHECTVCKMHFPSTESLQQHFDSEHYQLQVYDSKTDSTTPLQCKICLQNFKNGQDIWKHVIFHLGMQDNILSADEVFSQLINTKDSSVEKFKLLAIKMCLNGCNSFPDENFRIVCVFCQSILLADELYDHTSKHIPNFNVTTPLNCLSDNLMFTNNTIVNQQTANSKTICTKPQKGNNNLTNEDRLSETEEQKNKYIDDFLSEYIMEAQPGDSGHLQPESEVSKCLENDNILLGIDNSGFLSFPESDKNFLYNVLDSQFIPEEHNMKQQNNFSLDIFNKQVSKDFSWNSTSITNTQNIFNTLAGDPFCSENPNFESTYVKVAQKNGEDTFDNLMDPTKAVDHSDERNEVVKTAVVTNIELDNIKENHLLKSSLIENKGVDSYSNCAAVSDELGINSNMWDNSTNLQSDSVHKAVPFSSLKLNPKHTELKKYRCTFCNYSSNNSHHLREHLNSHTGEKPFKCKKCDVSYTSKSTLRRHILKHNNLKLYKCDLCDFKGQRSVLNNHMSIHLTEKRFECSKCDYICHDKMRLKHHSQTHIGLKPFKCGMCSKSYSLESTLKKHTMKSHCSSVVEEDSITSVDFVKSMEKCLQTLESSNNSNLINEILAENPNKSNNEYDNNAPNISKVLSKNSFVSSSTTSSLPAFEEYLKEFSVDINCNFTCNSKLSSQDDTNENEEESMSEACRSERTKKRKLIYKDDYVYDFNKRKFQPVGISRNCSDEREDTDTTTLKKISKKNLSVENAELNQSLKNSQLHIFHSEKSEALSNKHTGDTATSNKNPIPKNSVEYAESIHNLFENNPPIATVTESNEVLTDNPTKTFEQVVLEDSMETAVGQTDKSLTKSSLNMHPSKACFINKNKKTSRKLSASNKSIQVNQVKEATACSSIICEANTNSSSTKIEDKLASLSDNCEDAASLNTKCVKNELLSSTNNEGISSSSLSNNCLTMPLSMERTNCALPILNEPLLSSEKETLVEPIQILFENSCSDTSIAQKSKVRRSTRKTKVASTLDVKPLESIENLKETKICINEACGTQVDLSSTRVSNEINFPEGIYPLKSYVLLDKLSLSKESSVKPIASVQNSFESVPAHSSLTTKMNIEKACTSNSVKLSPINGKFNHVLPRSRMVKIDKRKKRNLKPFVVAEILKPEEAILDKVMIDSDPSLSSNYVDRQPCVQSNLKDTSSKVTVGSKENTLSEPTVASRVKTMFKTNTSTDQKTFIESFAANKNTCSELLSTSENTSKESILAHENTFNESCAADVNVLRTTTTGASRNFPTKRKTIHSKTIRLKSKVNLSATKEDKISPLSNSGIILPQLTLCLEKLPLKRTLELTKSS